HGYNGPDLVHATILPWFGFYGLEHAHQDDPGDAIPKLAFGRLEWKNRQAILPLSVRVHHALADGYHIHQFLEKMKAIINAAGSSKKSQSTQKITKQRQPKASVQNFFHKVATFVFPNRAREYPQNAKLADCRIWEQ
ncbi:MAG: hypothetical protein KY428_03815, partial [Bacteroidetes bacterium]|nr:hypothetical protein [Bacteroidota bacterium]